MTLARKLGLAQAPLAVALVLVGIVSAVVTTRLGERSRLILADNYRSVLAAQRMKESLERIDSDAMLLAMGRSGSEAARIGRDGADLESELRIQEGNITEASESAVTRRLRVGWDGYQRVLRDYVALPPNERELIVSRYFAEVQPAFLRVKAQADEVLAINQTAMVEKSDRAVDGARLFELVVIAAVLMGLTLGVVASTFMTRRLLRPLRDVNFAVRRFGEGDLAARATVDDTAEIAELAMEFNRMADKLERYRASTLNELIRGQQEAQAAIDGLPDPVLLWDARGQLHGANDAATEVLHMDPEAPAGEMFARADPAVKAVIERLLAHVLGGKGPYVPRGFEDAVRMDAAATGSPGTRIFMPRATPLQANGGAVTGAAIVFQDATKLFEFDELKNNLVATVAHEFRTPLTTLRMALDLCTEEVVGPLTVKQGELLLAAREDCERLQTIVDDVLDLSRIEAGQVQLHRRPATPEALVERAVEVHRAAAEQAQVTVNREVQADLPGMFVDPERLHLVLSNLINNALRYAPRHSHVVVRAATGDGGAAVGSHRKQRPTRVRFEVSDRGPGIASEHQSGLFEKFFRVPGSPQGGSGLGLFIARGVVEAHGGSIGVDSERGRGATFWFCVPTTP